MTDRTCAVILAAGKGTRMGSDRAKVLHEIGGRPLVAHVCAAAREAGIVDLVVVVGHQRELVAEAVAGFDAATAVQDEQLGTGHAVMVAEEAVDAATVVMLCGDAPLVPASLLRELLDAHRNRGAACTGVGARLDDPTGYGRMITDDSGRLRSIVEERDADEAQRRIDLINSGIFAFRRDLLFELLRELRPENAQGEYYLTDVPKLLAARGEPVELIVTDDADAVLGINTPAQLAEAERAWEGRGRGGGRLKAEG